MTVSLCWSEPAPRARTGATHGWDPIFAGAAIAFAFLALPISAALILDDRQFLGINGWIKPLKFEIALLIYLGTLSFYARWLPSGTTGRRWFRLYASAVVVACALEIAVIAGAAALNTASHFNTTRIGSILYAMMGLGALFLTSATALYGVLILRSDRAPANAALHAGLVAGLVMTFCLTVLTAGTMSSHGSHFVGGTQTDAGGVWLMGWSRDGGDLRVGHFFATHAMHMVPFVGWLVGRAAPRDRAVLITLLLALAYAALCLAVFAQALAGRPFLPRIG
jgi:hypothetical protein